MCPLFLSDFNETWIFSTDIRKILKYKISWKSVQWEPSRSMRTYGQTDRWADIAKVTVAIRNFVNAPPKKAIVNFEFQAKRQSNAVTHSWLQPPTSPQATCAANIINAKQTDITQVIEVAGAGQSQTTSPRTVYLHKIRTKSLWRPNWTVCSETLLRAEGNLWLCNACFCQHCSSMTLPYLNLTVLI
jgi:hypothetical protein